MLQTEFEALVGEDIDCRVYKELIEPVYMHHPGITCKADIAAIYRLPRGEEIIRDMLRTATECRRLEREASRLRRQIAGLTEELDKIQRKLKPPMAEED